MITPYYADDHVTLYHGDMREMLPALELTVDACVTDPPYGETSMPWDRWVNGWPSLVADCTNSMWCFGSIRSFTTWWSEFESWRFAQDVVWEKHNGSGPDAHRFRRVHEHALHFYRGRWDALHRNVPRIPAVDPSDRYTRRPRSTGVMPHRRSHLDQGSTRDGSRMQRSVICAESRNGRATHPTEKPSAILAPLIEYAVPVGGLVLDPFAGSASTLLTARQLGRRAIGIEANEAYCEAAAERLSTPDLFADHQRTTEVTRG